MTKLMTLASAVMLVAGAGYASAQTSTPEVANPANPAPNNPVSTTGAPAANAASGGMTKHDEMMKHGSMQKDAPASDKK